MNEGLIARRYALAMLKVAQKQHAAAEVYEKMKLFEQNYISHPDLHKALMSPVLSPRDKGVVADYCNWYRAWHTIRTGNPFVDP